MIVNTMPAKKPATKTLQTGQVFQDLNRSSFSISLLLRRCELATLSRSFSTS